MKKFSIFLILTLVLSLVFAFPGNDNGELKSAKSMPAKSLVVREAFMERSPGNFDPIEYREKQQRLFDWLMAESVPLTNESIITIRVSEQEMAEIENASCETCNDVPGEGYKMRIGIVKAAGVGVDFSKLATGFPGDSARLESYGMIQAAGDGGFIWAAAAESKNATALRLHFTNFWLPGNTALYIYNMNGEAFGPYTGKGPGERGDFWSHTVTGPVAYIQLRSFGPPSRENLQSTHFTIEHVGHLGPKFLQAFLQKSPGERDNEGSGTDISRTLEHCSYNAPCVEDASCYSGGAIDNAKYGVAFIQYLCYGGLFICSCSGGLVADTMDCHQIPYFLTANHCISTILESQSLELYWRYWTASCHGACYEPLGVVPRTLGADILSTSYTNGDYSLLKLWEDPPAGSSFLGWTTQGVAFSNNTELFHISHPQGAPQAYSTHLVDTSAPTCTGVPRGTFIYSRDVIGATESGSSGAPLMLFSGQVVGQLKGACGTNLEDPCDSVNNATLDGALAAYFPEVEKWLDPANIMHVYSIDLSTKTKGKTTDAIATVKIVDQNNNPVSDVTVTGTFSGDVSGTQSATTNRKGVATLKISKSGSISTFTFCVTWAEQEEYSHIYDPCVNVETCDTY